MQTDTFSVAVGRAAFRRRLPNAIPRAETVFLSTFAHGNFPTVRNSAGCVAKTVPIIRSFNC